MSDERAQKKTFRPYILTVACCACMVVATVGLTNAYGVFLTPVAEALGTGRGAISVHSTLCNLFTGLMAPLSIRLMKKFGLRPMVFAGMVLYSASSFLMAFASSVWQLNLLGALKGAGCSMYYFTIVTIIIGNWFEASRGAITGIISSFSGVGGAVFSPVLAACISRFGYRTSYVILAVLTVLFTLPALFCVKLDPREVGLLPYGHAPNLSDKWEEQDDAARFPAFRLASLLFALCAVATFLPNMVTGMSNHIVGYAESIGMSSAFGATLLSVSMVANILFKFLIGFLTDRVGSIKASQIMIGVSVAACLVLSTLPTSHAVLVAAVFLFGALYSFCAVGLSVVTRSVYGNSQYSSAFAIVSLLSTAGSGIGIFAIGAGFDLFGSYRPLMLIFVGFGVLSIILLSVIHGITSSQGKALTHGAHSFHRHHRFAHYVGSRKGGSEEK